MIKRVTYEVIILVVAEGSGSHRVAKQTGGADGGPFFFASGTEENPKAGGKAISDPKVTWDDSVTWSLDEALTPDKLEHGDRKYYRALWSYVVRDANTGMIGHSQAIGAADPEKRGHDQFAVPGEWEETVKCFYRWDFGSGGGDNGIYIDSFNATTGEFFGDDFVSVKPDDDKHTLTALANDGYIDSDTQIPKRVTEKITALDITPVIGPRLKFWSWQSMEGQHDDPPPNPPKPEGRVIKVKRSDIVDSVAIYNINKDPGPDRRPGGTEPDPRAPLSLPWEATFDPWWFWRTGGGRLPIGPLPGPPVDFSDLDVTRLLLEAVERLPDHLQARGLDLAADALDHTSEGLRAKARGTERS